MKKTRVCEILEDKSDTLDFTENINITISALEVKYNKFEVIDIKYCVDDYAANCLIIFSYEEKPKKKKKKFKHA